MITATLPVTGNMLKIHFGIIATQTMEDSAGIYFEDKTHEYKQAKNENGVIKFFYRPIGSEDWRFMDSVEEEESC
ncbi:hypothetical protein SAMN04488137_1621 [Fictibacillus solisalsi]|uniref:Uncharacterized protein n=1 Tax=Fictibacillus solisalsi TaxID=459525 RepID=A0A1G9VJ68_9BACL|nr:hypothetical protein [Fictibacillus solisalsi]SDM72209.1 hypothetical protein SAMN04488137_1621 [Fictibacillus solisalsi]